MKIISPITNSKNTILIQKYDKSKLINLYEKTNNIDVARFFEETPEILYLKCLDSGYKFFFPYSIAGDEIFYEDIQNFDWYYQNDKWEFSQAIKHIKKGDKVLEIGAGWGAFLDKIKNTNEVEAIEFNNAAIRKLESKGYTVFKKSIQELSETKENFYDVIVLFQVLEHISAIKPFIESCIKALKENGKLIIAVPNNGGLMIKLDSENSFNLPPHHMGHWDKSVFIKLQKYFQIKLCEYNTEPLNKSQYKKFYRILALHFRRKFGFFGRALDKLLFPFSESLIKIISKRVKGHSLFVVFTKQY